MNTLFMTNFSNAEQFGSKNLAAANESGTFEGASNTVCDGGSVVAGGSDNTIDGDDPSAGNIAGSSFIGAGAQNLITAYEATIAAGNSNTVSGDDSFVGSGQSNSATDIASFIGAGYGNAASNSYTFIGAGFDDQGSGYESFVGAGQSNVASGNQAFAGSGMSNSVEATAAFIGAGSSNSIGSGASYASIVGGYQNSVSGEYASIVGGNHNSLSGEYASIIGGYGNTASGAYAIVAGGDTDTAAGTVSFAAGYHADAAHNGSFVWSDYSSGSTTLKDTANNQFVIRASGGTTVYSNEAATAGVRLAAGSGSWSSLSDHNAKTDVRAVDDDSILAKVATLPVSTWRYTSEPGVRHAGPMAQDFYSAFGIGEDDRHITSIDEDGVALAAIKALSRQVGALRKENLQLAALSREVAALREQRGCSHEARVASR